MRSVLFQFEQLSPLAALAVALALAGLASLWAWRERRAGRLTRDEFGKSIALAVGVGIFVGLVLFVVSHFVHPIRIRSYGVMLMLAFAAGIVIAMERAGTYRLDPLSLIDLSLFVLLGSIIGSRAFYVMLNWPEFADNPRAVLNVWEGGLAFYGGLIGGTAGGLVFARWRHVRLRVLADLMAPSIAFGYAIARLGCFLNGCCHGGPTHLPWGVVFPDSASLGPVHPAQLYSALMSWGVGVTLLAIAPRVRVPGHMALWYLVLSSVERIITECFRHGYTGVPLTFLPALTQAQGASILLIIGALTVIMLTAGDRGQGAGDGTAGDRTAGNRLQVTGDRKRRMAGDAGAQADESGQDRPRRDRRRKRRR